MLENFATFCLFVVIILLVADFLHANQLDPFAHVSHLLTCIPDLLSSKHQLDPCIAVLHCNPVSKCRLKSLAQLCYTLRLSKISQCCDSRPESVLWY